MSTTAYVKLPNISQAAVLLFCGRKGWHVKTDTNNSWRQHLIVPFADDWESLENNSYDPICYLWLDQSSSQLNYDRNTLKPTDRRCERMRSILDQVFKEDQITPCDELILCEGLAKYQAAGIQAEIVLADGQLALDVYSPAKQADSLQEVMLG